MGRKATPRFLRRLGAERVSARRAAVVAAGLALAGCAVQTVQQRVYPRLQEGIEPIHRVALAPLSVSGDLAAAERRVEVEASVGSAPRSAGPAPGEATALVARYLAEALAKQGLDVTAPEDLGRALSESGSSLEPREVARLAAERFGAQGVLVGNVARFRERREGVGEDRAASVWFEVSLYKAPEGERLWTGIFNETQRPLSHNVLVGARYPGGGSRWLSVDELARWGAEQTALQMPLGTTAGAATGP
jgi:hypothetical protein